MPVIVAEVTTASRLPIIVANMKGVAKKRAKAAKARACAEPSIVAATPPTVRIMKINTGIMAKKGAIASSSNTTAAIIVSQMNSEAYRTRSHH